VSSHGIEFIGKAFYLIETGFENYYNRSGTCQFLITAGQSTAFSITVAGKDSTYSLGLHQAYAVTVEMSAGYFDSMIINNRTIDFDVTQCLLPLHAVLTNILL
jgi:hypothetical protein